MDDVEIGQETACDIEKAGVDAGISLDELFAGKVVEDVELYIVLIDDVDIGQESVCDMEKAGVDAGISLDELFAGKVVEDVGESFSRKDSENQ
ncbi:hypothetical protein Ddc_12343 [Ditylenchus destructor]|nr:hypothetical protein Ddc_12343 [Ditylenchus destructor]